MLAGIAVALVIVVAALFQEQVAAALLVTARLAARAARPLAPAVARGFRRGARLVLAATESWAAFAPPERRRDTTSVAAAPLAGPSPDAREVATGSQPLDTPEFRLASMSPTADLSDVRVRPTYMPQSTVHVESAARTFLEGREGAVSLDLLVRHLDRSFGKGVGIGLVESLRNRGLLRVRRRTDAPAKLEVTLVSDQATDARGD